jgi:tRNA (guanine-N7-)-methyltransferase
MSKSIAKLRTVRSFVRHGRVTAAQRRALDNLEAHFVLDSAALADLPAAFGRAAPKHLEIGFGMGESLAIMAQNHPEIDFLGIEVHRPGVGRLLARLDAAGIANVRVICADAVPLLEQVLAAQSLDYIYILFPDPWPKKRHHKRRLIQPDFVQSLTRVLKSGGQLHLATDWQDYAQHMLAVLSATPTLRNLSDNGGFAPRPEYRPLTKFEQRGLRLGHAVWDLCFERA